MFGVVLLASCGSFASAAWSQQAGMSAEDAEEAGIDLPLAGGPSAVVVGPRAGLPPAGGAREFLLVPESTNDRVMAFDAATGNLIDADFIPADPTRLSTPIHAILGPDGDTILVSDQIEDVVQEYWLDGTYRRLLAPAGGVDTAILDNVRGIALETNGHLLVSVGSGTNADAIAEFDRNGVYLRNVVANGSGGLDSPFDVLVSRDLLVGGIASDAIHRYRRVTGASLANFAAIDSFPEQLALAANGNLLVGNFSGTQEGVVEFTPTGALVGTYNPPTLDGYRGAFELPNGNILTSNGNGVHEIDRSGNLVETKISGVSARFIQLIELTELHFFRGD